MKFFDVKKIIRISALTAGLAAVTVSTAVAQTNANNNTNSRVDRADTPRVVERDNDTDWGWLGLLGLLGLAGLLPKKRRVEVQEFRDTAQGRTASGTGTTH